MIERVTYNFPNLFKTDEAFFKGLVSLLSGVRGVTISSNHKEILMIPAFPKGALPVTEFVLSNTTAFPTINLGDQPELALQVGNLRINSLSQMAPPYVPKTHQNELDMQSVAEKLLGHVIRVDHTGFNLPKELLPQSEWDGFVAKVANASSLYKYPTGEPWLFILPSTTDENASDITDFSIGREPKIEMTHDEIATPAIQLDIEVGLTRQELEALFPATYAFAIEGLEDSFRSLYVSHHWTDLRIRIDMRFKREESGLDWASGEWLVTDGGRVK